MAASWTTVPADRFQIFGEQVLVQRAQKRDEVAQIVPAQNLSQAIGHGRKRFLPSFDIFLLDSDEAGLRSVENEFVFIFALEDAGVRIVGLESDHHAFIALRDLAIGEDNGFKQVTAILLRADVAEVRPDVASLSVDAMATEALDVGTLEKYFFSGFGISSEQSFLIGGQGVIAGF